MGADKLQQAVYSTGIYMTHGKKVWWYIFELHMICLYVVSYPLAVDIAAGTATSSFQMWYSIRIDSAMG